MLCHFVENPNANEYRSEFYDNGTYLNSPESEDVSILNIHRNELMSISVFIVESYLQRKMNGNFDLLDLQVGGRKGKTCSMAGCQNTHQRCPSLSFFRFPKEISRAKEWLMICDRPDLMRRVDLGEINVNNYYVCETHFPNQILDYATRKILIKTALPLSMAETKLLPFSAELMMNALSGLANQNVNKNAIDGFVGNNGDDDDDDDYDDVENDNGE